MQNRKCDCATEGVSTTGYILSSLATAATAAIGIGSYYASKAVSQFCTTSENVANQLVNGALATNADAATFNVPFNPNIPPVINATVTTQYGTLPAQATLDIPTTLNATLTMPSGTIENTIDSIFGPGLPQAMRAIGPTAEAKCQEYLPDLVINVGLIATAYTFFLTVSLIYLSVTVGSQAKRLRKLDEELNKANAVPLNEVKIEGEPSYSNN